MALLAPVLLDPALVNSHVAVFIRVMPAGVAHFSADLPGFGVGLLPWVVADRFLLLLGGVGGDLRGVSLLMGA